MRRLTKRQRTAAVVLAAVALCLLTLDLGGSGLRSAHTGVRGSLGALYRGTDAVLGPVRRFVAGVGSAASNRDTISALRHQNAVLRGQLASAAAEQASSRQLAVLQAAADKGGYAVLPARVVALGPGEGFDWTVTLDVGSSSGVRVDQTVTDGAALVGRVLRADRWSSVVLLTADPGSGVGARDVRTGQVGVATGQGTDGFVFTPLDPAAVPRTGDRLVSGPAGDSGFVAGLAVGTITAVHAPVGGSVQAEVRPATSPTALDLVGVILRGGRAGTRTPLAPASSAAVAQGGR